MENTTISDLPSASTPLSGTEVVPVVQSGTTKKVAVSYIGNVAAGSNTQVQYNNSGVLGASANLTFDGTNLGLAGGTANGVAYLNGSKVLTTGSALTFDGNANLSTGGANPASYNNLNINNTSSTGYSRVLLNIGSAGANGVGAIKYAPGLFFAIGTDSDSSSTPMTFNLNGSEQMRLTSTGLGIGTSSPANKLSVLGSGDVVKISNGSVSMYGYSDSSGLGWFTGAGATGTGVYYNNTSSFQAFYTGGSERARIDSSGNLGLGVTPSAWGSNAKGVQLTNYGSVSGNSNTGTASLAANAYEYADNGWKRTNATSAGLYQISYTGAHTWSQAGAATANSIITFTQAMTLDASGNLGIGTSSPGVKLDVSGADGVRSRVIATAGGTSGLILSSSGNTAYSIKAGNADNSLRIDQDGTDRITLASGGNLGIGTSSPGVKLDVAGSVRSTGTILVDATTGSTQTAFQANDTSTNGYTAIKATSDGNGNGVFSLYFTNTETIHLAGWSGENSYFNAGNVGIGTTSPNASAILDAQSTTKGVRMPNMTTTQKNAISSPAAGLMVFDTTLAKLCVYSGSAWQTITSV